MQYYAADGLVRAPIRRHIEDREGTPARTYQSCRRMVTGHPSCSGLDMSPERRLAWELAWAFSEMCKLHLLLLTQITQLFRVSLLTFEVSGQGVQSSFIIFGGSSLRFHSDFASMSLYQSNVKKRKRWDHVDYLHLC